MLVATLGACGSGGGPTGAEPGPAIAAKAPAAQADNPETQAAAPLDDDQLSKIYEEAKASVESGKLDGVESQLAQVAAEAKDPHLRANASLFLGSLAEAREDWRAAVSHYKQARAAVPEEPSTHAVLALALSKMERYGEAVPVQEKLVALTPDDLQAWLILGELRFKSGDEKGATEAFAGYEMRRKGLLDGLTLKKDGAYISPPADRVVIAENLAPASDNGTALALLYALDSEPEAEVRDAIVEVMGMQRLAGYKPALAAQQGKELSPESRKVVEWALAEIARDPLDVRPGGAPWTPDEPAKEEAPEAEPPAAGG